VKHRLIRTLAAALALVVLALLGYFASAGFAGPLSVLADTTSSTGTDSTSTSSTSTSTSTSTTTASTSTSTPATTTTTTTATTTTTPTGPEGQIRLANGKISIPVTSVTLPARLVIDGVHFTPSVVTSRRTPVSVRVHVSDTRGYWVRDALVFARSTPLVTSTPPEQVTNQSGYATLTMFPRATFPLKRGYHVQFFLRTRKEGDSLLAGVSSRRLAQVATAR
jgi:cell wall-associated NlpC family hydrolase